MLGQQNYCIIYSTEAECPQNVQTTFAIEPNLTEVNGGDDGRL